MPTPKNDHWETCHQLVEDYDANSFKAQTQEVNNLLIFVRVFVNNDTLLL